MNPAPGSGLSTGEINELRLRQLDSLSIAYRGIHLQNRSVFFYIRTLVKKYGLYIPENCDFHYFSSAIFNIIRSSFLFYTVLLAYAF